MKELIAEKLDEYRSIRSRDPQLRKWLKDSDLWYWLYTVLRLMGRPLTRQQIVMMLEGKLDESLPLDLYGFVHGCAAVYKDMEECIQMQSSPDLRLLRRWYAMASGSECSLRDTNQVVYQWNYVPPHFRELPQALSRALKKASSIRGEDPAAAAAENVIEFLSLYPFCEDSIVMAGFMVMYEFIEADIPIPSLTVGEREFNEMIASCLGGESPERLTGVFERSLLNRLEAVLQVCRQAVEAN